MDVGCWTPTATYRKFTLEVRFNKLFVHNVFHLDPKLLFLVIYTVCVCWSEEADFIYQPNRRYNINHKSKL